jgi:hypothetical protein
MPFYEEGGEVRIHYEEAGSGFPLLVIPGGGLNSTVAGLATHPFNPFVELGVDKVLADLTAKGQAYTAAQVQFELNHLAAHAKQQFMQE